MKKIARYQYIVDDIEYKIKEGIYKTDQKLPTEKQLAEIYGVSRGTVNKALAKLEQDSIIYKVQGSGSFVKNIKINKKFGSSISFSEDIINSGGLPSSILLEYKIVESGLFNEISQRFDLGSEDKIFYFKRLRLANDKKVAISHTYVSSKIVPKIKVEELENSFYSYLNREYNIYPTCSNYLVSAVLPNESQKKILGIEDEALLKVSHYSFDQMNRVFEYNETFYIGTKFTYKTDGDMIRLS